jgi:hypothetical protein
MTECLRERLSPPDDYDPKADLSRSVEYAYEAIRARVAHGGRGWRGWPPEPIAAPDLLEADHD